MASLDGALLDFKRLDQLATGNTPLHRLDPRAKVLVVLVFIISVISFNRYEVSALVPFFIFPLAMVSLGNLPAGYLARKIALLCPFALMVGVFNPLFDREILVHLGPVGISGGWISFASIIVRSVLTVGGALVLVGVTGFTSVCSALERMGMPQTFAVQLLFLYRYIFVLTEEGARMARARELRSFGRRGMEVRVFGSLVGHLLLRTWERAERIHLAMLCRGFRGEFHLRRPYRFGVPEILFITGWTALFILFRLVNVPALFGGWIMEMFR
ncbi:cobalt ABC transporter permease [Geobacter pickeringii]|uniref:Cobalt ABC transporter permease n=1 Tax=Geobacter pickeringii TaxID=345632 RepID=A0A0B5BI59_9BACT|nr:cobalt ECF transporter T component CbiQ [Geobacter pickeringii]AJE04829.1 cobalt ABC transporter permease [Geobacter pickeringii]